MPRFIDFVLDSSSEEDTPVVKPPVKAIPAKKKESSSESSSDSDSEPEAKTKAPVLPPAKPAAVSKKAESSSDDSDSSDDEEEQKPKSVAAKKPEIKVTNSSKPAPKKVEEDSSSGNDNLHYLSGKFIV